MNSVTYRNGVATIGTRASTTDVHVSATACLVLQGDLDRPSKADVQALAVGFCALETECSNLSDELKAARAGQIGKDQATAMQGARRALAELRQAVDEFMAIYDTGEAPDSAQEKALRTALGDAEHWLLVDSGAATARAKLLKET